MRAVKTQLPFHFWQRNSGELSAFWQEKETLPLPGPGGLAKPYILPALRKFQVRLAASSISVSKVAISDPSVLL